LKMKPMISDLGIKFVSFSDNPGLTNHIIRVGDYLHTEGFKSWVLWEDDKWIDECHIFKISEKLDTGIPTFVNTLNFYLHSGADLNEFRNAFFTPIGVAGVNSLLIKELKQSLAGSNRRSEKKVYRSLTSLFDIVGYSSRQASYLAETWLHHLRRGLYELDRTDSLIQLTLLERDLLRVNSNLNLSLDLTSEYGNGLHQDKSMPILDMHELSYTDSRWGKICVVCEKNGLELKFQVGIAQELKGLWFEAKRRVKRRTP